MPLQDFDLDDGLGMLVFAEVFVDSNRGAFAISYAINNQARTEDAIAAGENSGGRGHQSLRVDGDQSAWRQLNLIFGSEEVEARGLADCHNDRIAFDLAFAAFEEGRVEAFVL